MLLFWCLLLKMKMMFLAFDDFFHPFRWQQQFHQSWTSKFVVVVVVVVVGCLCDHRRRVMMDELMVLLMKNGREKVIVVIWGRVVMIECGGCGERRHGVG